MTSSREQEEHIRSGVQCDEREIQAADSVKQDLWHDAVSTPVAIFPSLCPYRRDTTRRTRATHPAQLADSDEQDIWFDAISAPADIDILRRKTTLDTTAFQPADNDQQDRWFDAVNTPADIGFVCRDATHMTRPPQSANKVTAQIPG